MSAARARRRPPRGGRTGGRRRRGRSTGALGVDEGLHLLLEAAARLLLSVGALEAHDEELLLLLLLEVVEGVLELPVLLLGLLLGAPLLAPLPRDEARDALAVRALDCLRGELELPREALGRVALGGQKALPDALPRVRAPHARLDRDGGELALLREGLGARALRGAAHRAVAAALAAELRLEPRDGSVAEAFLLDDLPEARDGAPPRGGARRFPRPASRHVEKRRG